MEAKLYHNIPDLLEDVGQRWAKEESNADKVKGCKWKSAFVAHLAKKFGITERTVRENWFSKSDKRRPKFTLDALFEISRELNVPFEVLRTLASKGMVVYNPRNQFYREFYIHIKFSTLDIERVLDIIKYECFIDPLGMGHIADAIDADALYRAEEKMPHLNYVLANVWEEFKGFFACIPADLKYDSDDPVDGFLLLGYFHSKQELETLSEVLKKSLERGMRVTISCTSHGQGLHILGTIETGILSEDMIVMVEVSNESDPFVSTSIYHMGQDSPQVLTLNWQYNFDLIKSLTYRGVISPYVYMFTGRPIPEDDPSWKDPLDDEPSD